MISRSVGLPVTSEEFFSLFPFHMVLNRYYSDIPNRIVLHCYTQLILYMAQLAPVDTLGI